MTIQLHERRVTVPGNGRRVRSHPIDERASEQNKIGVMLVAQDLTLVQSATRALGTRYGDEIDVLGTTFSGEECLAQAQWLAPQVAVIDLDMPGLSGLQTIPLLRILFPEMRIIALAQIDDDRSRRAVIAAGGDDVVCKATVTSDLATAIRNVMSKDMLARAC
jgi:DNA-binding NarL/FixJ family response regulator